MIIPELPNLHGTVRSSQWHLKIVAGVLEMISGDVSCTHLGEARNSAVAAAVSVLGVLRYQKEGRIGWNWDIP